jgi:hypothetical protein
MRFGVLGFTAAFVAACGTTAPDAGIASDGVPPGDVYAISHGGTRLKARFVTTTDGLHAFDGWFDTARSERCAFGVASDGEVRCLPFTDCDRQAPHYACEFLPTCPARIALHAAHGTDSNYTIDGELPPDAFVRASVRVVPRGGLHAVVLDADDGAHAFGHFVDAALGFACIPTLLDVVRCAPLGSKATLAPYFRDADCRVPLDTTYVEGLCDGEPFIDNGNVAESSPFSSVGAAATVDHLFAGRRVPISGPPGYEETCQAEGPHTLRPVGAAVPSDRFFRTDQTTGAPLGTLTPKTLSLGGGWTTEDRSRSLRDTNAGSDWADVAASYLDGAHGGARCQFFPTKDALRCLPGYVLPPLETTIFADAKCTVPLDNGEDVSEWRYAFATDGTTVVSAAHGVDYTGAVYYRNCAQAGCGPSDTCDPLAPENQPTRVFRYDDVPLAAFPAGTLTLE